MALIADTGSSNSIAGATAPDQFEHEPGGAHLQRGRILACSRHRQSGGASGTARDQHGARPAYSGSGGYAWYPHSEPSP